jgi:hypothetical protein
MFETRQLAAGRWRPWYVVTFYGGPLDGLTRRAWRAGSVYLDEAGQWLPQPPPGDCYWLLHEPEGKQVRYGWDAEASDYAACLCCPA